MSVLKNNVIDCTSSLWVCVGQEAGIEAAVHLLNSIYNDEHNDTVLLVDASNAFNSLKRDLCLRNISYTCPAISAYVKDCYNFPSRLFIIAGKELKSTVDQHVNQYSRHLNRKPGRGISVCRQIFSSRKIWWSEKMVVHFNKHWSKIRFLAGTNKSMACG